MDPTNPIVTALVLGATSALKSTAEQAVKDAYSGFKSLLLRKYPKVSVTQLEEKPESESRRAVVTEDLKDTPAAQDAEVLQHAKNVLDAVEKHAPEAAAAVGVNLENIRAASLRISEIQATGAGVLVKSAEVSGDIEIHGVRAGLAEEPKPPKS